MTRLGGIVTPQRHDLAAVYAACHSCNFNFHNCRLPVSKLYSRVVVCSCCVLLSCADFAPNTSDRPRSDVEPDAERLD